MRKASDAPGPPVPGLIPALAGALLALLACVSPALGQPAADLAGRTITAIEFRGLTTLSEDTLLFYLGIAPGDVLNPEQLNAGLKDFWSRGLVDDIRAEAEPDGEGARLIITVVERPVLRSVEYEGLKRLSRTDIDDRVASAGVEVREGLPISRGQLERLKEVIEEMYREKGYRFAQVIVDLEEVGPGEVRATLSVDEGDKVRIEDIRFEGNTVFSGLRLRWAMKKTKESGFLARMLKKDIYNPATLDEDLNAIRDLYRSVGYKNVLIGEPQISVTDEPKRRLILTIPIEEGERWRFGEVSVEGNETFPEEAILRLFELRPGSWLRTDAINKAIENVDQIYKNSGYIFARVEPELVERDDKEYVADLVIHIAENEQFKVARIEFEGNRVTRDKVLRRELRVQEGLNVNLGAVRNSIFKINQLGFFTIDEDNPVDFDPDTESKTVDLVFRGEETRRTELQFGAGWSDFDGFFGQVSVRTQNFLGRGEAIGVSVQSGRQRDIFDVSYFIPWFLDRPQSIGFQLFKQDIDFRGIAGDRFVRESLGGVVTYGRSFKLFHNVAISYNRSEFKDQVLVATPDGTSTVSNLNIDNSSLRPVWTFNSIDNRFEPTRGLRLRTSLEYAGGLLGGDNFFLRPEVQVTWFKPVSRYPLRTVFGANVEAGYIEPFGNVIDPLSGERVDRTLSPLEKYFLGGENSVRGHGFRSIFVRNEDNNLVIDPNTGSAVGGDSYFQINLEQHFLTGGPFRVLLFVDGGNVYGDYAVAVRDENGNLVFDEFDRLVTETVQQSIDLSRLRWTAGVELRLLVPILGAPLRFIYAVNLDEQVGDDFDTFRFSIGTSF